MTRGSRGSSYKPDLETEERLILWRRYAERGMSVAEIAAAIGISRDALDRYVCRARQRGDPDAIRHPKAAPPAGEGFTQALDPHYSRQRQRRRLQQVTQRDVA
jgi:transposase-like protein